MPRLTPKHYEVMELLSTFRVPGQDLAKCKKCKYLRQLTAEEGALYIVDRIKARCKREVGAGLGGAYMFL